MDGDTESRTLAQQLRAHPFSAGMDDSHLATLQTHASAVSFEPEQVLFTTGGLAEHFFLVHTGIVSLRVPNPSGPDRRIQSIHEGSVLGWSWLFPPYTWQFVAVAETPVRAIAVEAASIRDAFETDHDFAHRVLLRVAEAMATRLHAYRREVSN